MLLRPEDIRPMADSLQMTEHAFIQRYTVLARNRAALSLAERADGACVFLEGAQCRVYRARPAQCRDFNVRWRVSGGCPGANARR